MSDYILYILIRTDLPSMGPGRACAMASHATNALMKFHGDRRDIQEWSKETLQGFGTAIVLSVPTLREMERLVGQCQAVPNKEVVSGIVTDPDYRFTATSEILPLLDTSKYTSCVFEGTDKIVISKIEYTCAYVFGSKAILEPILKDLPLYPN